MIGSMFRGFSLVLAIVSLGAGRIHAQNLAGRLASSPRSPAGRSLPTETDPRFVASLYALRDAVYDGARPAEVEKTAQSLIGETKTQPLGEIDRHLILARIEYLLARSWNESGDKKKAIPHFEAAMDSALLSMESGEHPAGVMALTKPLSELCLLKNMGFLIANGPKISKNAKKTLDMEPGHPGALIILANAKAYPPAIFGGNPREALEEMEALLRSRDEGFEKDDLFDIRTCVATALVKLDREDEARIWFKAALELYPGNKYALAELAKIQAEAKP
jgi:tetratricopeptide (TPR) repeat protein